MGWIRDSLKHESVEEGVADPAVLKVVRGSVRVGSERSRDEGSKGGEAHFGPCMKEDRDAGGTGWLPRTAACLFMLFPLDL